MNKQKEKDINFDDTTPSYLGFNFPLESTELYSRLYSRFSLFLIAYNNIFEWKKSFSCKYVFKHSKPVPIHPNGTQYAYPLKKVILSR